MIYHLALILSLQLLGEVTARSLGLPLPGPVIGMIIFVGLMVVWPRIADNVRGTAMGLLGHLSLLFVPAGVGVVSHLKILGEQTVLVLAIVVLSTILSIAAGALVFVWTARLTGQDEGQGNG